MQHGAVDPLGTDNLAQRVEVILSLTSQLAALIELETAQLEQHRPSQLRHTEEKKAQLSTLYARQMRAIQTRPQLLLGMTEAQKQALRQTAEKFQGIVADNARRLVRASAVTKALVVAIGEELHIRRQPSARYGASGNGKAARATVAFSHDRSI